MQTRKFHVIRLLSLIIFTHCASTIVATTRSYTDPTCNYDKYHRFNLVQVDKLNPLLEKELLSMVKEKLIDKGYIYDDNSPDFLVTLFSYCNPYETTMPEITLYKNKYVPGETQHYSGQIDGYYYSGTLQTPGHIEKEPYTIGGGKKIVYYRFILVDFIDYKKLTFSDRLEQIWRGEVESSGSNSDIRIVAPYMLDKLLHRFPPRTTK